MLWTRLTALVQRLFRRDHVERDLDEELDAYLQHAIERNRERGMAPEDARRAALVEFGGADQVKERVRDSRAAAWVDGVLVDFRYALRTLTKSPSFACIAMLTVAIGMGATTAVFSVVDRVLFRRLPYPDEARLVSLGMLTPFDDNEFVMAGDFVVWRRNQISFNSVTSFVTGAHDCDLSDQNPLRISCLRIDSNFLPTFGIKPVLGRNFEVNEDRSGVGRVLISHDLWRSRFGSDPAILNRSLQIDGQAATIVGVLPPEFEMPTLLHADVLVPSAFDEALLLTPQATSTGPPVRMFGRLKSGITMEQAAAAMEPLFQDSIKRFPLGANGVTFRIRTLRDRQIYEVRTASWVLLAAVVAVLLIACANVANLLAARATARHHEFALRAALGAGRIRLTRQTVIESSLLCLGGAIVGCVLASALLRVFVAVAPAGIVRLNEAAIDQRVLMFTLAATSVTGLLIGIIPAFRMPSPEALVGSRAGGGRRTTVRNTLVSVQIAVSLVLMTSAGLLLKSLWNFQNIRLGMQAENVLVGQITLGPGKYGAQQKQFEFFEGLEARLQAIPGVAAYAMADTVPFLGGGSAFLGLAGFEIEDRPEFTRGMKGNAVRRSVGPGYFAVLGIPVVSGRSFNEDDRRPDSSVVIVSESFAKRLFPNQDPVGKTIRWDPKLPWRTIVGVVGDVRNNPDLTGTDDPECYIPRKHSPASMDRRARIVLRVSANAQTVSDALRREVAELDPALPVTIAPLNENIRELTARPRFNATLLSSFAFTGILLAAIGLYGVISFLIAQRTQEIGVRIALGATPGSVVRFMLMFAGGWTLCGTVAGIGGAVVASRFIRELLFHVVSNDSSVIAISTVILIAVALTAASIPARRAARMNPVVALRHE